MPILNKGTTYATGNQVTATNLNNLVDLATFAADAVDNVTTQLSGGAIIVKDGGVTPAKLSTGKPSWDTSGNLTLNTATTGRQTVFVSNTGGQLYAGTESSTGGTIFTGSSAYAGIIGTDNATPLEIATNGTVQVAINSSGNVGVGTTSPTVKLDIVGSAKASGTVSGAFIKAGLGASNGYLLDITGDGSSGGCTMAFVDSSNSNKEWRIDQASGALRFIESNVGEQMCIKGGGNVGIGTASPSAQLHTTGSVRFGTFGAGTLTTDANGNVSAANASTARTNLGLVIGTDVQAYDADLAALAALSGTNTIYYRSGANTWSPVTIGSNITFSGGTLSASSSGGTIGGSTGSTQNAILKAADSSENTVASSGVLIDGSNNITNATSVDVGVAGYKVSGTKVVGARGSAIADANTSGSYSGGDTVDIGTLASDIAELENKLNLVLAAMRTHGLIAT
jgi:hypothetical protein